MSDTVAAARRALAARFRAAGLDTPDLDARLLVEAATGLTREALAAAPDHRLTRGQAEALKALADRRLAGESAAHILGRRAFWTLDLKVDERALAPRPETELVVEAGLERLDADRPARVLDLGVGSGAILLAILAERPRAFGVGLDRSAAALSLAADNAARCGLSDRVAFIRGDWGAALGARFDLVVSNPPYITAGELASLPDEVRRDPAPALDGGPDGLDAYRALAGALPALLAPGARAVLELGAGQSEAVAALMRAGGALRVAGIRPDLAGIPRAMVLGRACE